MKALFALCLIIFSSNFLHSQNYFNFRSTSYFTTTDTVPGSELIAANQSLNGFNYNNASNQHPIFQMGCFYPVKNCDDKNLWLRLRHVADDPNGTGVGYNIPATIGEMFRPANSDRIIGGWGGFLYDFQIYSDMAITGERINQLDTLYPIDIFVESLETLSWGEWEYFAIINSGSIGWKLVSKNFSGDLPNSHPGFNSEDSPYNGSNPNLAFIDSIPLGSERISAIDNNSNDGLYSEFRIGSARVSQFRYGYEYRNSTGYGYQGISLSFGNGPVIIDALVEDNTICNAIDTGGITSIVLGTPPLQYLWSNGDTNANLSGSSPGGDYILTVTDANGCSASRSASFYKEEPYFTLSIDTIHSLNGNEISLTANCDPPADSYSWNTGESTASITVDSSGLYVLSANKIISSETGDYLCPQYDTVYVDILTAIGSKFTLNSGVKLYPNPFVSVFNLAIESSIKQAEIILINSIGDEIFHKSISINNSGFREQINLNDFRSGIYLLKIVTSSEVEVRRLVKL